MADQVDIVFGASQRFDRRAERDRAVHIDPGAGEFGIVAEPMAYGVVALLSVTRL